jgi:regulator of protease activity HflC (stomatin/prohibitin superfamily)
MISLKISSTLSYRVLDGNVFLQNFFPEYDTTQATYKGQNYLREVTQVFLREYIATIDSKDLVESPSVLADIDVTKLNAELEKLGLKIEKLALRDIVFPKKIQDLYAKKLEAKIRSEAELENARTVVSTTRALKNASKMLE